MQSNAKSIVDMAEGSTNAIREHAERLETLKDRANKQFREALANELSQYQKALKHEGIDELALPILMAEYSRYLLR